MKSSKKGKHNTPGKRRKKRKNKRKALNQKSGPALFDKAGLSGLPGAAAQPDSENEPASPAEPAWRIAALPVAPPLDQQPAPMPGPPPLLPGKIKRILLLFFLVGTAITVPCYLTRTLSLAGQQTLTLAAGSLPAGGDGYVFVKFTGRENRPGLAASAKLTTVGRTLTVRTRLTPAGAGLIRFPLKDCPPGAGRLSVTVLDLTIQAQVAIQAPLALKVWAAKQAGHDHCRLTAWAQVQRLLPPQATGAGETVFFKLFGPNRNMVSCEQVNTNAQGLACFQRTFLESDDPGDLTLKAAAGAEVITVRLNRENTDPQTGAPPAPEGPLSLSWPEGPVQPGGELPLVIKSNRHSPAEAAVELVSGAFTLQSRLVKLNQGAAQLTLTLPDDTAPPLFIRAWPLDENGPKHMTTRRLVVHAGASAPFSLGREAGIGMALINNSKTAALSAVTLTGGHDPVFADSRPATPAAIPFALHATTDVSRAHRAFQAIWFWQGCLLFLFAIPLLCGLARLFSVLPRYGLTLFAGCFFLLFLTATANYPLFGTAVLAIGLFMIHQLFHRSFKALPAPWRLGMRWAVPILCLAAFLNLILPLEAFEAAWSPIAGRPSPKPPAQESRAAQRVEPDGRAPLPMDGPEAVVFVYGINDRGAERTLTLRKDAEALPAITATLPDALTAGSRSIPGDRLTCPITIHNRGRRIWTGTVSIGVDGRHLLTDMTESGKTIAVPPEGHWVFQATVTGGLPGTGTLSVTLQGTRNAYSRYAIPIVARGDIKRFTWNGLAGNNWLTGANPGRIHHGLPQNMIYGSASLRARLFPGPLSQLMSIAGSMSELPLDDTEKVITVAHACNQALVFLAATQQVSDQAPALKNRLASALLKLPRLQHRNGAFSRRPAMGDSLATTAGALLLEQDLQAHWPVKIQWADKAREYLLSLVRLDGSFRTGRHDAPPDRDAILRTCMVASALGPATPEATRDFLRGQLQSEWDQTLLAPLLCACKFSGALSGDAFDEQVKRIEKLPDPMPPEALNLCAWWAYGLCETGTLPEVAQKALANLALMRTTGGAFATLPANQLFLRALNCCTGSPPYIQTAEFMFDVNNPRDMGKRYTITVDHPDRPVLVPLTDSLLPGAANILQARCTGSLFTPYQLTLAYAVPYPKTGGGHDGTSGHGSAPISVQAAFERKTLARGDTVSWHVTLNNRRSESLPVVRMKLRVPPNLVIAKLPAGLQKITGTLTSGSAVMVTPGGMGPGEKQSWTIPCKAVFQGTAFAHPVAVTTDDPDRADAFSTPVIITTLPAVNETGA